MRLRKPPGQLLVRPAVVKAHAARLFVRAHARKVRGRAFARAVRGRVAAPDMDARAGQRRLKQRCALVEPRLRRASVGARREREQRVRQRARALKRLALGRDDLDGDGAHHRLRRAAGRRQRAEREQQHHRRQPDEKVCDDEAAAHPPQQSALEPHQQLGAVVEQDGRARAEGDGAEQSKLRVSVERGVAHEQAQQEERARGQRHARHHAPQPLARLRETLGELL